MGRRVNPNASKRIPWSSDKAQASEAQALWKARAKWRVFNSVRSNPNSSPYLAKPISTLCFLYSKKIKPLKGMDQGGSEEGRAGPEGRSRALHR